MVAIIVPLGLIPVMLMYKIGNKGMSDYYTAGQIMNNTIIEYVNGMEEIIMKDKKNALNGKDYINIGIFTAIYMVIVIAIACTVGLIPIGFILLPVIIPVIGGIPMMMYFTKIKKFGMILIFEILFGIVMILTGMGCDLLLWGIVVGIIGKLILRAARYSSGKMAVFCYGVLSTCICGNYIHWISASEEWLTEQTATYGDTYVYTIHGILTNGWAFPVMIIGGFLSGIIGGLIGRKVMKKHFEKSGLV